MSFKTFILPVLIVLSLSVSAQKRTYAFSEVQSRNESRQWECAQAVGNRTVCFSPTNIDVKVDRDYHLNIVSKTDLPNKGVIYLCKDDMANQVTVMLIDDIKMYLYSPTKRFLINFRPLAQR